MPSPASPFPLPAHKFYEAGERKEPADLISSSGALRDGRIMPLKEETLVESSGKGSKVEKTVSPLLEYKLYPLTGAEVSSCQPDFPSLTNVRLQQ